MGFQSHPLTADRFDDFAEVVNPRRRSTHCWCVTHRLGSAEIDELGGGDRERAMRALAADDPGPGVITYRDDEPVGWCNIGPRADIPRLVRSTVINPVDELPVWSVVCLIVRSGHRRQGIVDHIIDGAVAHAARNGAPAVEAYPVDPEGRMDTTMAFVGTRSMFERAGFAVIGRTGATAGGLPRLVMRRELNAAR